jgi:hypothetical protein
MKQTPIGHGILQKIDSYKSGYPKPIFVFGKMSEDNTDED